MLRNLFFGRLNNQKKQFEQAVADGELTLLDLGELYRAKDHLESLRSKLLGECFHSVYDPERHKKHRAELAEVRTGLAVLKQKVVFLEKALKNKTTNDPLRGISLSKKA